MSGFNLYSVNLGQFQCLFFAFSQCQIFRRFAWSKIYNLGSFQAWVAPRREKFRVLLFIFWWKLILTFVSKVLVLRLFYEFPRCQMFSSKSLEVSPQCQIFDFPNVKKALVNFRLFRIDISTENVNFFSELDICRVRYMPS